MSYKPLLKLDLFTLLLACGDNKNSMTCPSPGSPPGREKDRQRYKLSLKKKKTDRGAETLISPSTGSF